MEKKYEIIVYGATGFTGQICCKYLRDNYADLVWAIGGRSKEKLERIKSDFNLNCDVVVADGGDIDSLRALTGQTKVVLSTAGPFARYGSLLVQACVENETHYTDITGENHWVRGLIEKHHEEAASKGIRIIPSCGYDSIPSDLGTFFTISQFDKPVSRVDVYHQAQGGASGGTTETIFTMDGLSKEMRDPFVLNPDETVTEDQREKSKDGFVIEQVEHAGAQFDRIGDLEERGHVDNRRCIGPNESDIGHFASFFAAIIRQDQFPAKSPVGRAIADPGDKVERIDCVERCAGPIGINHIAIGIGHRQPRGDAIVKIG